MVTRSLGSLTKEFPLAQIDRTILAIRPGMTLDQLRRFAAANTHSAIPALLAHRFLLVGGDGRIVYDRFLSLVASERSPTMVDVAGGQGEGQEALDAL